jgi:hypothetical protein
MDKNRIVFTDFSSTAKSVVSNVSTAARTPAPALLRTGLCKQRTRSILAARKPMNLLKPKPWLLILLLVASRCSHTIPTAGDALAMVATLHPIAAIATSASLISSGTDPREV